MSRPGASPPGFCHGDPTACQCEPELDPKKKINFWGGKSSRTTQERDCAMYADESTTSLALTVPARGGRLSTVCLGVAPLAVEAHEATVKMKRINRIRGPIKKKKKSLLTKQTCHTGLGPQNNDESKLRRAEIEMVLYFCVQGAGPHDLTERPPSRPNRQSGLHDLIRRWTRRVRWTRRRRKRFRLLQ